MVERSRLRLLAGLGAAALIPGSLAGCVVAPADGRRHRHPPHYYDYYYYPHTGVYFHIHSGYYYYFHDNRWRRARRLPDRYRLHPRHRRKLTIREEEPWHRHEEHRRTYGPPEERYRRPPSDRGRRDDRDRSEDRDRDRDRDRRDREPDYRRDREEREHNRERFEEYRRRGS